MEYNEKHGIVPKTIIKPIHDVVRSKETKDIVFQLSKLFMHEDWCCLLYTSQSDTTKMEQLAKEQKELVSNLQTQISEKEKSIELILSLIHISMLF